MTLPAAVVPRGGRIVAVLGIVLVALSIRSGVAVIGPVFSLISDDLGLGVIVLSLVGAAPPLMFAVAGLLAPNLTKRWGLEGTLVVAILAILIGQGARALSHEAVLLVASTSVIMTGIGLANVLLPPLVRRYFPRQIAPMTSLYLVLMGISGSAAAFAGVQIAQTYGWRIALVVWAVVPVFAVIPWISMLKTPPDDKVSTLAPEFDTAGIPTASRARRAIVRSPTAWAITGALAITSINIYGAMAFLPTILAQAGGVSAATAGVAVGIVIALGIPQAFIVPLLARRAGAVVPMLVIAGVCDVAGWGGMLTAPAVAPFLWAALIGLVGILFPLSLLLVNTRTRDHQVTVALSAFVQGIGYLAAGLFAFGMGVLHDATGSWTAGMVALLATALVAIPAIAVLRHRRYVDDELERHPRVDHTPQ
ncbi:MAG: MFS transporter [Pseudolysinimonas sp.]